MGKQSQEAVEKVDDTLADSFPASDPPSWTLGNGNDAESQGTEESLHPVAAVVTATSNECDVCGNDYDKAFTITTHDGQAYTFDSLECAIEKMAPHCAHCGVRVVGHGMEKDERFFCCAHCAQVAGVPEMQDRA